MAKMIFPGDEVDMLRVGELVTSAADQLAAADADPRKHRIDLYRIVEVNGKTMVVRLKLTVTFVSNIK